MSENYPPTILSIGTTAIKVLSANAKRKQYLIVYPSSTKVSANTSALYVGVGFVPSNNAGSANAGHIMSPGEQFGENAEYPGFRISTGEVWLIAGASGQIVEIFEISE